MLTQRFKTNNSEIPDETVQNRLTDEEENAVNYVGGML